MPTPTTSGTTSFTLTLDDLIEEAFQRCMISSTRQGYDLREARTSLNILLAEWGNRGVHLWKVKSYTQALTQGTATYSAPSDASDILEVVFRNGSTDTSMTKISRSEYINIPNKTSQGTPSQYYIDRQYVPTITLYQTPDTTGTEIFYYYVGIIEDAGAYTNNPDVYYNFIPCLTSGLAYYLSMKKRPELTQQLKLIYEDEMQRALTENGQRTSVHIVPQSFYPGS
jgi:hypothetical protein